MLLIAVNSVGTDLLCCVGCLIVTFRAFWFDGWLCFGLGDLRFWVVLVGFRAFVGVAVGLRAFDGFCDVAIVGVWCWLFLIVLVACVLRAFTLNLLVC